MDFFNSPNRFVPDNRSRRISTFHLSLISVSVVSTGQAGSTGGVGAVAAAVLFVSVIVILSFLCTHAYPCSYYIPPIAAAIRMKMMPRMKRCTG